MDLVTYGILKNKMKGVTDETTEAKEIAQHAEATVENLNTQFQNAMSALTVDSEVQNIRVGEDGATYPSAGEAVRGQIADLKSDLSKLTLELSDEAKTALLNCFQHVAWIDAHGQAYYDALDDALNRSRVISSISAVFTQGSATIYDTDELYALKQYLTVTATYSDDTTKEVNNYTLSGSLNVGTNTITVTYSGKTATFTVNVTQAEKTLQSITATFNQGSAVIYADSSLNDLKPYLTVTARYSDSTTKTVTGYTLSGTLTTETSTITVSYGGMTDTFSVTVTDSSTPIPSGYTLKSYVQSNGDAYIDTGYRLTAGVDGPITQSFEGKFAVSAVSENKNLFGYQGIPSGDVSLYRFMPFIKVDDDNLYYYGKGSGVSSAVNGWEPSGINEISVYFYGYFKDYPVFIINGVQTTGDKYRPLSYSSEQGTVYLCAQNYKASGPVGSDTTVDGGYIRCYGFKIQEHISSTGNVTVMDFKPCVRNSDGVAGFYETVNGMFYPSIGGNAFVAGD